MKQDLNGVRTPEDVVRRYDLGELDDIPLIIKNQKEITLEVSKKVNGDEVISAINLTPEQAAISADKISLEGKNIDLTGQNIEITSDNFSVDNEGNMICNNATAVDLQVFGDQYSGIRVGDPVNQDFHHDVSFDGSQLVTWNSSKTEEIQLKREGILYLQDDDTAGLLILKNTKDDNCVALYGTGEIVANKDILCQGNITCVSLTQTSLEEKKKDFEKLESGLDIVKNVDIYKYHLKDEKETDKKHIGFVIGDKFNYRKEITSKDNDGAELYSMVSVLWRAVQEQQAEIERLKEGKK